MNDDRRRTWLTVLLFMALGVCANVLVAWGCALWAPLPERRDGLTVTELPDHLSDHVSNPDPTDARIYALQRDGIGVRTTEIVAPDSPIDNIRLGFGLPAIHRVIVDAGVPFRCFRGEYQPMGSGHDVVWLDLAWHNHVGAKRLALPVRPLFVGMVANTLFWSLVMFAVIRGPFVLRGWLAARRDDNAPADDAARSSSRLADGSG